MKPTYEELEQRVREQDKEILALKNLVKQLQKQSAHLEDKLNKNSKNSSKPPSTDQKPNSRKDKKKIRKTSHPGASRQLLSENSVTSREVRKVDRCSHCNSLLYPTEKVSRWQQIELPEIKPLVHQIDLQTCKCPNCQREEKPKLAQAEEHLMGPRLEAFINLLLGQFRQSHRAVREFISQLIPGLKVSQGLISKVKNRASESLEQAHQGLVDSILMGQEAIHVDATGWRHHAKNEHALVLRAGNRVSFSLVPRQNGDTIVELMKGMKINHLVSDRGLSASKIDTCLHQYCLSHLLRNICGLAEHPNTTVTETAHLGEIYDTLQELFKDKHRLKRGEITISTWRKYGYDDWQFMQEKIEELLLSNPSEKVRGSCKRILKDWNNFKVYLRNTDYPMTNNPAEEALRNLVITRKLCFGSRSNYGRQWRACIQSCIETLRREGRSVWDFLTSAIQAARSGTTCSAI